MRNPVKGVSISAAMCATAAVLLHVNAWSAGDAWSTAATAKPAVTAAPAITAHKNTAASDTVPLSPATTMWALRGLSQTTSAESMGDGRLTVSLSATWYRQDRYYGWIQKDADVTTGILAFSYGINPYLDIFGSAAGYSLFSGDNSRTGQGSTSGGIQGSLPVPASPLCLGMQLGLIGGTAYHNQPITIGGTSFYKSSPTKFDPDGYDFFDVSIRYELLVKIMETLTYGNDSLGIKFHFNQGTTMLLQADSRKLLLLGVGIQGMVSPKVVVGLEFNSRTKLHDIQIQTDPLWLTPSFMYRTPNNFNVFVGVDVSLSADRNWTQVRALEPYRIFGGVSSSYDLFAGKRRAEREKALRDKREMERKIRMAQARSDSLARRVYADSILLSKVRESEARRADSMAQKSHDDSIALADTRKKLDEERSKRSDAEKQLLSTGLLILDAVYFETGKAQISINSFPYLNIIAKMLTKYPKLQIEVAGHTDNVGNYDKNMTLSQNRAEAVKRYMVQVVPDLLTRISARGYGSTQPKAPNTNADGRKMNRRVELQVLNKDVLKEYN